MNKSQLIDAVAADSGLSKADSARAIESLLGDGHQDPEERRRGQHHGLRQVLGRQKSRPPGRQPAHWRARENQSLQGPEVLGRRRAQAGDQPQEEVAAAMTLVSELDLPTFDYTDPSLRGERFHEAMARAARGRAGWPQAPFGYMVLDREAGEFFLRTRSAIFPGMKIAEIFGVTEGPLYEQMERNILHVNGADHSRLRSLVNPALSPRAVERYRPRDEGLPRRACSSGRESRRPAGDGPAAGRALRVRGGLRQAVPVAGDRLRDGRAARGRAPAAPLVELDPEAVRRRQHGQREGADRAGRRGVLRVRRGAAGGAPRRPRGRPDLDADRRRRGGRPAVRRGVHQPRLQHPRGRRRHDARASWRTRSGCWPNTPSSGACSPNARSSPAPPSRSRCATSRSRRSRPASSPRRSSTATSSSRRTRS